MQQLPRLRQVRTGQADWSVPRLQQLTPDLVVEEMHLLGYPR